MSEDRKVNILLVDDQPANLLALASMLDHPDYRLVQASSGEAALRCLLDDEFALVLLDVQMPSLDGFETAALIRSREKTSYTPIIFITAINTNDTHVSRGYSMGAVDYIFKPVIPEILRAKAQVFVELFRKSRELKTAARDLARANERLSVSEERYRRLFAYAADAVLVADAISGRILDANESAARLHGYSGRELLRMRTRDLRAAPREGVLHHRRKDGTAFPVEVTETRLLIEEGRQARMVLVRDITERLKAAEAERALQHERLQREFVANVSHELRTPITAVKCFSETLLNGALDDKRHRVRFVKAIERNAERLGLLVEDLLTLAAMESGQHRPSPGDVPLLDFVRGYIDSIESLAARRSISIRVDIPRELTVRADPKHLEQILQNLIDNAIKYNRTGGSVDIEGRPGGGYAQVTVRDTGIGIAKREIPKLFTRFHRTGRACNMQVGGTGLGLYIIKNIVEANGGRIWAESRRGAGSAFHFTLPLLERAPAAA